jgi:hypothetical protein
MEQVQALGAAQSHFHLFQFTIHYLLFTILLVTRPA